jgi:hypothetical protein
MTVIKTIVRIYCFKPVCVFVFNSPSVFETRVVSPVAKCVGKPTDHSRIYEVFSLGYLILNIMQEVLLCSFLLLLEDSHHRHQQKQHVRNMDH